MDHEANPLPASMRVLHAEPLEHSTHWASAAASMPMKLVLPVVMRKDVRAHLESPPYRNRKDEPGDPGPD
jgi:hypothetical protein